MQIKARNDYMTKPRYEGDPGTRVRVTKLEQWRDGTWAHVRFPGERVSKMIMHTDDLQPCAS